MSAISKAFRVIAASNNDTNSEFRRYPGCSFFYFSISSSDSSSEDIPLGTITEFVVLSSDKPPF
ncbi:hypothetical protein [Finegoldia magna]|uniref:hypothetical protein n=1 Tax=Finegoldia magna TaxID=1260 RepID=UPI0011D16860|nr:hypothetical protein [Finegoldia magna]